MVPALDVSFHAYHSAHAKYSSNAAIATLQTWISIMKTIAAALISVMFAPGPGYALLCRFHSVKHRHEKVRAIQDMLHGQGLGGLPRPAQVHYRPAIIAIDSVVLLHAIIPFFSAIYTDTAICELFHA